MMTVTLTPVRRHPGAVAVAGSASIAISFGFARYGYGLFVPTFRAEFGLSASAIGLLGSLGYVAYLVGLVGSVRLTARCGPRFPVLVGGAAAAGGSALVAGATGVVPLVLGVVVAASSPGWAWAPFADVVAEVVREPVRDRVMSVISTGTTFGLVVAGPLALGVAGPGSWRTSWLAFAVLAVLAGVANRLVLPAATTASARRRPLVAGESLRPRPGEGMLFAQAAVYGAVASGFYTYAVDLVRGAGLDVHWSALLWTLVGIGGVGGVWTGDAVRRLGLRQTFGIALVLLAAALLLLTAVPRDPVVAGLAAAVFGLGYMPISTLLALWSGQVHADAPTVGFTRVLVAMAAGSIVAPLLLGPLADAVGLRPVFVVVGGLCLAGLGLRPRPARAVSRS